MSNMPFVKLLTEHRRGDLEQACSQKLESVLEGIRDQGGQGELTLKLKFKQNKFGQVEVYANVSAKIPEPAIKASIFFMTPDGQLTRRDPNQMDIEDIPGARRRREDITVVQAAE